MLKGKLNKEGQAEEKQLQLDNKNLFDQPWKQLSEFSHFVRLGTVIITDFFNLHNWLTEDTFEKKGEKTTNVPTPIS